MLDVIKKAGMDVISVGKIADIFAGQGVTEGHRTGNNEEGMAEALSMTEREFHGLCFVNLVDFDMTYGHRNDVDGYAAALTRFDAWLPSFLARLGKEDALIITADHGCDPSTPSTDHSREHTPMLLVGGGVKAGVDLGTRVGFCDIAATVLEALGLPQENVEGKSLYFLKVGDLTMFSLEDGEATLKVGDSVDFDIDFTKVGMDALGVEPLNTTNILDGTFSKEKNKKEKCYDFFMNVGTAKLVPAEITCEKVFAVKGSKIFRTPLEYIFDASVATVSGHVEGAENVLTGTVNEILDYGHIKYARVDVEGQSIVVEYDGAEGDKVDVSIPAEAITIKDKTIDIIIA
jgi:hypothetical protein